MSLKLFIFLTTSALLVYGNDVERRDNAESYITKEAAKELNKLSARGKQQDLEYDEILEHFLSVQQSGDDGDEEKTFEKKYFDYLPNDLDSEDVADEDSTRELLKLENARVENPRRMNSRRFRRDLLPRHRSKRQSIYYVPYPLVHYRHSPNLDFYFPQEYSYFVSRQMPPSIQSRSDNSVWSNPWHPSNNHKKFHEPNNFYLPPQRPGTNVPQPPHNNPSIETNPNNPFEVDDRIAGFEGEDKVIWPNYDNRRPNSITPDQRPTTTPSYNRPQSNDDSNFVEFPGGNAAVDIETPPDIFDPNYKLTTRAPLIRPTASPSKSPSRNRGTKKPGSRK